MITNIQLDPAGPNVNLEFRFFTPQSFTYTWQVMDATGTVLSNGHGQSSGIVSFNMGPAPTLIGNYLRVDWTIIDPVGAGNVFHATATAVQGGQACTVDQITGGTTSSGAVNNTTIGKFN